MLKMSVTCLGAVLSGCLLSGCGGAPAGAGGTSVVAAFYPFAYVADRVAGAHASVTNLTSTGAEPHDLELAPQQVAELAQADVVIYEPGFQPAVDDAVEENAEGTVVEVTDVAGAIAPEDEHVADTHGHDHTDLAGDPHLWQNPVKLAAVAREVAGALARADRDHAAGYRRNAGRLSRDLRALDREYARGLADCERRTVVTSHAAFGHLADRYGLQMVPIAGVSPDAEPSPGRLAELQRLVTQRGVTTVFTETLASPALARTLADEVGVRTAVLDPIEGLSDATADEDYFSLMRSNLRALRRANGCS
ncbi:MAG TPA: metal ABC transporter substrate-binding protein [Nocardioidaceae bacterium]|nr:metal ABC transporter substrate-binding protein [Nocardioidaceae bacterium]